MTQDRARKRATRERVGGTRHQRDGGDSYVAAVRTDPKRNRVSLTDLAPAGNVPAPAVIQMCRHVAAAEQHLWAWRKLAGDHWILPDRRPMSATDVPEGPNAVLEYARLDADGALDELRHWTERSAYASGATSSPEPGLFDPEPKKAWEKLYPTADPEGYVRGWCSVEGGRMPQPGDTTGFGDQDTEKSGPRSIRFCLPGEVTKISLTAHARGKFVRPARDVVPGTPAAAVWDAHARLHDYVCGWMDRRGDSPADLAAAVDGLDELADVFATAVGQVAGEIQRRVKAGTLTGVDQAKFTKAAAELTAMLDAPGDEDFGRVNNLSRPFYPLRQALVGAKAALGPTPLHSTVFGRKYAGKTPAELRAELGNERFANRQIEKTTLADHRKADVLESMLAWMHAIGADTYDPDRHLADVQAAQR